MKQIDSIAGKCYIATAPNGGTVTDEAGRTLATVEAGEQKAVWGTDGKLYLSDDDGKLVLATFKSPLLALRLLGQGENALPAGYTRAEFLESTGTQRISVARSLTVAADCRFTVKAQNTGTGWQHAFGARVAANSKEFGVTYNVAGGSAQVGLGGSVVSIPCALTEVHEVSADAAKGTVVCGDETRSITSASSSMSSIGVFQRAGVSTSFTGRIFKASIFNEGKQFLQLVPALDPNGTPCMYDRVSKTAFTNSGTGQFIAGMTLSQVRGLRLPAGGGKLTLSLPHEASIDRLAQAALERARANGWTLTLQYAEADVPAGYRRLDFLESTGTQYIDTGVKLSSESEVRCGVAFTSMESFNYVFGGMGEVWLNEGFYAICENFRLSAGFATQQSSRRFSVVQYALYNIKLDKNDYNVNGTQIHAFNPDSSGFTEQPVTCSIFSFRRGSAYKINPNICRIYSFTISRAGVAQVDYVPCIAPDGKLGMYNKVDGTLKENAGSGAFIAGLATIDDVRKLWLPETNGELTVSVPSDTPDSAVEQLRKNNPTWQIAIQYRTDNEN
ncbi:MAG: hypothetical protein IJZ39_12370 [Oscillospiraceae bacterium]|nr:hypothetical protein [Oscillospiraceae bacterium]